MSPAYLVCFALDSLPAAPDARSKQLYAFSPPEQPVSFNNLDIPNNSPGCEICALPQTEQFANALKARAACNDRCYSAVIQGRGRGGRPTHWTTLCEIHCGCRRVKIYRKRGKANKDLAQRLRSWVPKGMRYCGKCDIYRWPKKSHKGICESLFLCMPRLHSCIRGKVRRADNMKAITVVPSQIAAARGQASAGYGSTILVKAGSIRKSLGNGLMMLRCGDSSGAW